MADPFAGWMKPPVAQGIEEGTVHVWGWHLSADANGLPHLGRMLSADERARMARYKFADDAARFLWARAGLRTILGDYLSVPPNDVHFTYGEYGKPALDDDQSGLYFNLSHTNDVAVAAFSRSGALGIDLERIMPVDRSLEREVFTPEELAELQVVAAEQHTWAFFNGWTRKEAVCKAEGLGFQLSPQSFRVSLLPGEEPRLLGREDCLSRRWHLVELPLGSSHAGCLALAERPATISWFRWEPRLP